MPELTAPVMSGVLPLSTAYTEAQQKKQAKESREEQARRAEADLALLRRGAPDLAELGSEERMPLKEAMAVVLSNSLKNKELSGFSKTSLRELERTTGLSHSSIAYARVVFDYAPELKDAVMPV